MPKARSGKTDRSRNHSSIAVRPDSWGMIGQFKHLLAAIALLVLICLAFANSFKSGMVLDNRYIIEEYYKEILHDKPDLDLKSWEQVKSLFQHDYWWPKGASGLYRPITMLSYWFDYVLLSDKPDNMRWSDYALSPNHQLNTTSYHWINLLLHWTNAMLVYGLGLVLFKRTWQALAAAALFATHPITTESVTNIIGRADLFAAMTVLGGLLLYIRSTQSRGIWRLPWLIGLMLLCAFGFFAKESAVAIGAIVPLYWLIFKFDWKKPSRLKSIGSEFLAWCFMLPPLIALLLARAWIYRNGLAPEEPFIDNPIRGTWQIAQLNLPSFAQQLAKKPLLGTSFLECKMTAIKVLGKLLMLLVWPLHLSCDYSYEQIPNFSWHLARWDDWQAIIALLVCIAILIVAWRMFSRNKTICFCILFFLAAALPTSNLIVTIGSIMAERFMYLPLVGFVIILSSIVFAATQRIWQKNSPLASAIAIIILSISVLAYSTRTFVRNFDWESEISLWSAAQQVCPNSFRCYQSLAFALYEQDSIRKVDTMIALDERALPIVEKLPDHLNNSQLYLHLGIYYSLKAQTLSDSTTSADLSFDARSQYEKAAWVYERGIQIDRAFNEVNRAKQLRRGDRPDEIADVGRDTLYENLAMVYQQLGLYDQAYHRLRYQSHLSPGSPEPYLNMAYIQAGLQKYDAAAVLVLESLILERRNTAAWSELEQLYNKIGPPAANALLTQEGRIKLNNADPFVQNETYLACCDLIRTFTNAKMPDLVDQVLQVAADRGVPKSRFDEVLKEPPMKITPW